MFSRRRKMTVGEGLQCFCFGWRHKWSGESWEGLIWTESSAAQQFDLLGPECETPWSSWVAVGSVGSVVWFGGAASRDFTGKGDTGWLASLTQNPPPSTFCRLCILWYSTKLPPPLPPLKLPFSFFPFSFPRQDFKEDILASQLLSSSSCDPVFPNARNSIQM